MKRLLTRALRLGGAIVFIAVTGTAHADGDATQGEKKFETCATCHATIAGQNGVGPSLHGIIGRKAGEIAEFRYSAAMKRSGLTWTAKTLDDFITDPQKTVPGNRMSFAGLPDAADRADLIAYLEKATK